MKPGTPPRQSIRLLDQIRKRIWHMHYSLGTEQVYLYWIRFFIRSHGRDGQMQRPRNMSAQGIEAFFLTMLATERKVSASTTMIYTHVRKAAARVSTGPLDRLAA